MPETSQIIITLIGAGLGAGGGSIAAYAAIRSDLAALRAVVEILSSSLNRAHQRIDEMQQRHGR